MNFNSMKDQVERAKIKAVSAAKKLSLNEMARQDEYIRSEGLNVTNKMTTKSKKNESDTSNNSNDYFNGNHVASSGMRNATQSFSHDKINNGDGVNQITNVNHDDDNDSVDSLDRDPILQMVKSSQRTTANNFLSNLETQIGDKNNITSNNDDFVTLSEKKTTSKRKDPNRFMADLDARLATPDISIPKPDSNSSIPRRNVEDELPEQNHSNPNTPNNFPQQQKQQQNGSLLQSFAFADNKMDWFRKVASPKIQQSFNNVIKQVPGGVNLGKNYDQVSQDENDDIEMANNKSSTKRVIKAADGENIHLVSVSSLALGEAENAELERINQLMNNSNQSLFMVGLDLAEKNRHYLLIVLTFVLTTMGYFYTRNKSDESMT